MPLGALTDIEHVRGSSPRLTARVAAEGQAMRPGGGGVAGFLVSGGALKGLGSDRASAEVRAVALAARWPSLGSDETRGRDFEIAPEGYSKGRQPGAACKADPALFASTAAPRAFCHGRHIASAEGSEARPHFTAPPSRPTAQRTAPGGFGLPAHDRDAKGARPPQG